MGWITGSEGERSSGSRAVGARAVDGAVRVATGRDASSTVSAIDGGGGTAVRGRTPGLPPNWHPARVAQIGRSIDVIAKVRMPGPPVMVTLTRSTPAEALSRTSTRVLVCQGNDAHYGCRPLTVVDNPASLTSAPCHSSIPRSCQGHHLCPTAPLNLLK
jgi:hypothetical protein